MSRPTYHISVVGLWHLGEVYSAGLAELGVTVVGIDPNPKTVEALQAGELPLFEPGLETLLRKHLSSGRLRYTSEFSAVRSSDIVWLTFDTFVNYRNGPDERLVFKAAERLSPFLNEGVLIVCSSQLGAGGTRNIEALIRKMRPKLDFHIAYVPENLQLGKALKSFMEPQRIVAGVRDSWTFSVLSRIFSPLHVPLLRMSPESAELSKHALNSFLATSLSFIYDIADVCEHLGADVVDVTEALRSDARIGAGAYLDASIGFSGGTLGRDLQALRRVGRANRLRLPVIEGVWRKNQSRRSMTLARLEKHLGTLGGKTVGLLGVTYKPGTSTLRASLALELAELLRHRGVCVRASDPGADTHDVRTLYPEIAFSRDPAEMARGCHAILLLTGSPEFRRLRPAALAKVMRKPRLFFDGRNLLKDKKSLFARAGMLYYGVGRGC